MGKFMELKEKIYTVDKYVIRKLNNNDESILQNLCDRCADFYIMSEGKPPKKSTARNNLESLPPNKDYSDKIVWGIFKNEDQLIAVIDIVKDFPNEKEYIIGLMMIDPVERGKGIGSKLHDWLKEWCLELGVNKLRIGVITDNNRGYNFWTKLGYKEVKRVKQKLDYKENIVIVMNFSLFTTKVE